MRAPVMTAMLLLAVAGEAQAQARNQIQPGETIAGELTANDLKDVDDTAMDLFQFRGEAGRIYTITLKSASFDTYLKLRQNGATLWQDDDSAGGTDSQITYTPSAAGTYEILAGTLREAFGAYTVSLAQSATVAPVAAAPQGRLIRPGETLRGTLSAASPKHDDNTPYEPFVFDGRAGQRVSIGMASEAFDSFLVLVLRQAGASVNLDANDDGGGGRSASITYTLPSAGRYEIRANAVSATAAGDFTLRLDEVAPAPAPTAQTISYGRVVRGGLAAGDAKAEDNSYYDLYRFTGRRGDRVRISMASAAFDTYLVLYATGGSDILASNDDGGGEGTDSLISFTLPADGSYDIRANSLGVDVTGDYTFGVGLE